MGLGVYHQAKGYNDPDDKLTKESGDRAKWLPKAKLNAPPVKPVDSRAGKQAGERMAGLMNERKYVPFREKYPRYKHDTGDQRPMLRQFGSRDHSLSIGCYRKYLHPT
jgi:hypothetical protein